jgi:hypothetical protein
MTQNFRQNILSDYERQLTHFDVPEPGWLFLGSNSASAWQNVGTGYYDVVSFLADWENPVPPGVGVMTGAMGESIVHELPLTCRKQFIVKCKDYDEELFDQLKEWHAERTELRLYAYAEWFMECYLTGYTMVRPRQEDLLLTFTPFSLYVFKPSITAALLCDFTDGHPIFNAGILTHCYLYGGT